MSSIDKELKEIIEGCIAGKSKFQEKLHRRYYGLLMSICLRYTKDYMEAEEVLQKSFIKIFKNINKYEFKGSFDGWIKRITVNSAIDYFRKSKKSPSLLPEDYDVDESQSLHEDADVDNNFGYQYSPEQVMEAIQLLSPAYRTVFNLYVIEEYQHKEISEMLGIHIGTSKSNLLKAKQKLRQILEQQFTPTY